MTRPRAGTTRLSYDDWTERALALLMDEGVGAIKVQRLCDDLGVTKGSFYWHFTDLEALMAAIAQRWTAETREVFRAMVVLEQLPPLERIRAMALHLLEDRSWSIERALRDWARTDETVAAVIREGDQYVFMLIESALRDLGHTPEAARMRAGLLVFAGIGFAHGQSSLPQPTADDIDDLVGLLAGEIL